VRKGRNNIAYLFLFQLKIDIYFIETAVRALADVRRNEEERLKKNAKTQPLRIYAFQ
jgi:hypothetical protein